MRTVKCPSCGRPAQFGPENKFRPFCSERCQLVDLGAWAEERFAIPTEDSSDAVNENSDQHEVEEDLLPPKDRRN